MAIKRYFMAMTKIFRADEVYPLPPPPPTDDPNFLEINKVKGSISNPENSTEPSLAHLITIGMGNESETE